jgi:hypothetical protein
MRLSAIASRITDLDPSTAPMPPAIRGVWRYEATAETASSCDWSHGACADYTPATHHCKESLCLQCFARHGVGRKSKFHAIRAIRKRKGSGWADATTKVPCLVDLTSDDATPRSKVVSARKLAVRHGRTPAQTTGAGDCLFHAVAEEAKRKKLVDPRARNVANRVLRPAVSNCARQEFVQRLMTDHPEGEWRLGRSQTPREAASYPDFIVAPSVWGNTFDVALLAWVIEDMRSRFQPNARTRLVVFDGRDGVHWHHPVGFHAKLCAKTKLTHGDIEDSDICIGIDGCHWWSAPPSSDVRI